MPTLLSLGHHVSNSCCFCQLGPFKLHLPLGIKRAELLALPPCKYLLPLLQLPSSGSVHHLSRGACFALPFSGALLPLGASMAGVNSLAPSQPTDWAPTRTRFQPVILIHPAYQVSTQGCHLSIKPRSALYRQAAKRVFPHRGHGIGHDKLDEKHCKNRGWEGKEER